MTYTTEAADAGWRAAYEELKRRDTKMVKDYREEVDTLLVFVRFLHVFLRKRPRN
jgi:hypothetical protein